MLICSFNLFPLRNLNSFKITEITNSSVELWASFTAVRKNARLELRVQFWDDVLYRYDVYIQE